MRFLDKLLGNETYEQEMKPDSIFPMNIEPQASYEIIVDTKIREKYKKGWENKKRKEDPIEVVIHGTAGGTSITDLLRWMAGGERAKEYLKGIALFHYGIGREGETIEVIDTDYWVYHSSSGSYDKKTIGIEMLNPSKWNDAEYTVEQYEALFSLIKNHLFPKYSSITRITSHRYNTFRFKASNKKQCPGPKFDWGQVNTFLRQNDYEWDEDGNLRYNIMKWR